MCVGGESKFIIVNVRWLIGAVVSHGLPLPSEFIIVE